MTDGTAPETKKLKWWQRPITWVLTIVVGAVGAYLTNVIVSGLESVAPTDDLIAQAIGTDAFKIYDLHRIHNVSEGRWGYVVAPGADPAAILQGSDERGYRAWAEANNAVDLEYSSWELTIEGTRESTVEIVNIVPVLQGPCRTPLGGGIYQVRPEGEQQKILLEVDLTKPNPTVTRFKPQEDQDLNYFGSNKITLPRGEKNTIILRAYVAGKHCTFRYRLEYLADGKRSDFTFGTPKGDPFEVTGYLSNPMAYAWIVPPRGCWPEAITRPMTAAEVAALPGRCLPHDSRIHPKR